MPIFQKVMVLSKELASMPNKFNRNTVITTTGRIMGSAIASTFSLNKPKIWYPKTVINGKLLGSKSGLNSKKPNSINERPTRRIENSAIEYGGLPKPIGINIKLSMHIQIPRIIINFL